MAAGNTATKIKDRIITRYSSDRTSPWVRSDAEAAKMLRSLTLLNYLNFGIVVTVLLATLVLSLVLTWHVTS